MPEAVALATTKRKFYKALDSLADSSQVSLPSTTTTSTTTKRPATPADAFDEARERATKRLRHSTSTTSLTPKTLPSTRKPDSAPPNFSPWSHETFLARLKTFSSVSLWHPKPDAINEVEWAKRGWVCVDVNTVACRGGCEKRVVISLDSRKPHDEEEEDDDDGEEESALERALAERYKDVIITGHAPTCLWRKTGGCKDDIYRLQVVRPSVWQPELRTRFQSILGISNAITNTHLKPAPTTESLLKDLPPEVLSSPDPTQTTERALEIALHGWRGATDAGSELLHCDACFQRIGLWMYQPGYRGAEKKGGEEEEDPTPIDLQELHRDHCPWRNPCTQQSSGSLKGLNACEVLRRIVGTYARDQRRRKSEEKTGVPVEVEEGEVGVEAMPLSREETERRDKERESRMRKIKNLFSLRRRGKSVVGKGAVK